MQPDTSNACEGTRRRAGDAAIGRVACPPAARAARWPAIHAIALAVVVADAAVDAPTVEARPRPAGRARRTFEANKTFGLGIMLGAPSGLSGKYFLGPSTALDFGIGTIYRYRHRRGVHLHADILWHPMSLASTEAFELPLYAGVGARFLSGDRCYQYDRGRCEFYDDGYTALGVRGPLGIAFDFNNVPIDIFIEIALVLDFIVDHDERYDDDALFLDLNGAVGFRYYFN